MYFSARKVNETEQSEVGEEEEKKMLCQMTRNVNTRNHISNIILAVTFMWKIQLVW